MRFHQVIVARDPNHYYPIAYVSQEDLASCFTVDSHSGWVLRNLGLRTAASAQTQAYRFY